MKHKIILQKHLAFTTAAALALILAFTVGCKTQQPAARTDQQISTDIQAKIHGETALASQNIDVTVANGVATLTGSVSDESSRALAGNDSGSVAGVKTVVNNLTVQSAQQAVAPQPAPEVSPAPSPSPRHSASEKPDRRDRTHHDRPEPVAPPEQVSVAAPSPSPAPPTQPPPPPPPPMPVVKEVTLPAGTVVAVRITETLDSKNAQPNDVFHGSLAADLGAQGVIAIPRGSAVMGRIVDAREAAHFQGNSLLSIELTQLTARGQKLTLVSDTYTKAGAGRGKNTAEKAGGGAALGAIIGALAGGGKGAAIGGLAGGAAGTGVNAATRGQQTVIPTETLVNFRLQSPITLTVTILPPRGENSGEVKDPQLQAR